MVFGVSARKTSEVPSRKCEEDVSPSIGSIIVQTNERTDYSFYFCPSLRSLLGVKCERRSPLNINYICVVRRLYGISMWFVHQSHGRRPATRVDAPLGHSRPITFKFVGLSSQRGRASANTRASIAIILASCCFFHVLKRCENCNAQGRTALSFRTLHYPFCWSFYVSFFARSRAIHSPRTHSFPHIFNVRRNCGAKSIAETLFRRRP